MLIIPYRLTIAFLKTPFVNWTIIGLTVLVYVAQAFGGEASRFLAMFVLRDWDLAQFIGSIFLHGGISHLAGNMVFLWVFGNAICSTVGNRIYPFLYLLLGITASAAHLAFNGAPSIGASGAIAGVMGMSLVLFPVANLDIAYVIFLPLWGLMRAGVFTMKCFWLMIVWFLFNVVMGLLGGGSVAYWAHVGGFVAGLAAAGVIVRVGRTKLFEPTLFDVIAGRADRELVSEDSGSGERVPDFDLPVQGEPDTPSGKESILKKHESDIHDLWMRGPAGTDPPSDPPGEPPHRVTAVRSDVRAVTGIPAPPAPQGIPKFRILRVLRSGDVVTCYFVNEGDQVGDLRVDGGDGLRAEIHPDRVLKPGDPGWIKATGPGSRGAITFSVTFDGGRAGRGILQFRVPPGV